MNCLAKQDSGCSAPAEALKSHGRVSAPDVEDKNQAQLLQGHQLRAPAVGFRCHCHIQKGRVKGCCCHMFQAENLGWMPPKQRSNNTAAQYLLYACAWHSTGNSTLDPDGFEGDGYSTHCNGDLGSITGLSKVSLDAQPWRSSCGSTTWLPEKGICGGLLT